MEVRALLILVCASAVTLPGSAHAQIQFPPGVGPTNPNRQNEDLETRQRILSLDEQNRLEEQRRHDDLVRKFMNAIKVRKYRFTDFDQVVIHGKMPMTPEMLAVIAESPYAADIAYYLGKHTDQSGAIALMPPKEARSALQQIESAIATENSAKK